MILDYVPSTKAFTLTFLRGEADPGQLMREHGLDFSTTASVGGTGVCFTRDPYAAATWGHLATPRARGELHGILQAIEQSYSPTSAAHIACPSDRELWGFQKASVEYALSRRNTLVGDQPGLGKTPIAICYANEIKAKRVLVICPASIRLQWAMRIREWTTMRWPYHVHVITNGKRGAHEKFEWTIVSYDLARTPAIGAALAQSYYDLIIMDEAHYVKESTSGRTRAIFGGGAHPQFEPLHTRAAGILALTGTPLPNRPREAYTLARGLCHDAIDWASEDHFRERYNPSRQGERVDPKTGQSRIFIDERTGRHAELQNRLRAHFMVRHLKRDVMPQLKLPLYDIVQLEETGPVKQTLKAESLLDIDPENLEGADATLLGHVAVVRRMMGIALAPQIADYADMLINGGEEKLVIFAWHIEVLDILENRLRKHGVVRIDGRTSATQKMEKVDAFRQNPRIQVALGNILSMGVGTDGLQDVASHALIAEPDWTPGNNQQCVDRLDRGGQQRTVQADFFVAPGSFAERILASALRKNSVTHEALDKRS